jgi:hypothetical protein
MKLIEIGTTPIDKMFTGGPVSYTPGSAKKSTPAPAPEPEPVEKPTEPDAPPPEQGDVAT